MRKLLTMALIALTGLAGCDGATHSVHHPVSKAVAVAQACPPGASQMGCSVPHTVGGVLRVGSRPRGNIFPDVSSYQGHPNWVAAKSHISMAVVKAWEFRTDPSFSYNANSLKALHIKWSAYDFVRYCNASGFIAVLHSVGGSPLPPVLDMEVSSAQGCAVSMAHQIYNAFHVWPVIYTSPGSYPGGANGGLKLWVAAYGPSSPPCFWTCRPLAWQYTDGHYGYPTYIPGVGTGDANIDYGFSGLAPKPKPAHPVCFGKHAQVNNKTCKKVRPEVAKWTRARDASRRSLNKQLPELRKLEQLTNTLKQRTNYFDQKVNQTIRTYS